MDITIIPVGMLGTNCYLLRSDANGCAVIDPGAQPDKIIGIIEEAGLTPKYVLLTHGHYDHIEGVNRIMEQYPQARLCIGERDLELLTDSRRSYSPGGGVEKKYLDERTDLMKEGGELTLDELTIRVMDTPGHTKGGVTYLCRDAMFAGDTLFRDDIGRCDLYGGDYGVMLKTLKRLSELEGDYVVYPGHGPTTQMGYERKSNRYIREALA